MSTINDFFANVSIGKEPTQTVYGYAFGFAATQQVASIDVQVVVQAASPTDVDLILGARLARAYGPFWSRMVHRATWGAQTQTLEFKYTPASPYQTGPISANSANETAFAVEMAFRASNGTDTVVKVDGFRIRLVFVDTTTTAWTNPGTVSTDSLDAGWYNPERLAATDGSEAATDSLPNIAGTSALRSTGYGFAIPSNATITGLELMMKGRTGASVDYFLRHAYLTAGGDLIGANRASRVVLPKSDLPPIGGARDDWQASLTSAMVNRADFGVEVSFFVEQLNNYGSVRLDSLPLRIWGCL